MDFSQVKIMDEVSSDWGSKLRVIEVYKDSFLTREPGRGTRVTYFFDGRRNKSDKRPELTQLEVWED